VVEPVAQIRARVSACSAGLVQRYALLVPGEPGAERLQGRIERSGNDRIAGAAEVVGEIPLELEHVAEILGPGKAKAR